MVAAPPKVKRLGDEPDSPLPKENMGTVGRRGGEYASIPTDDTEEVIIDFPEQPRPEPVDPVSLRWIYMLSIASFGVGSSWALEFAIVTPYFEKSLSADKVLSHAVWIAGPISGLIIAPVIGALSDRCTSRFGRRRPFIVGGLLATVFGMLTFSNATTIASLFAASDTELHRKMSITFGVLSFCILDLAINTTMWPVRALQGDLVPSNQQHLVQSASVVMASLGDLTVNGVLHLFDEPIARIRLIFLIAAILYTATTSSLLIAGTERQVTAEDPAYKNAAPSSLNVLGYLRDLPPWMWRIGGTYALGFFTFYCFMPYASSWMGSSVLGGRANAPPDSKEALLYEKGVNLYGQAGIIRGIVQILFSAFYPKFLQLGASPGQLMCLGFIFFATVTMIFANTHNVVIAQLSVILYSLPNACLLTLPIGLTVSMSDESNRGRYLGALNVFAVVPQLIDTAYTGFMSKHLGEASVMRAGAAWSLLTALSAIVFMREGT